MISRPQRDSGGLPENHRWVTTPRPIKASVVFVHATFVIVSVAMLAYHFVTGTWGWTTLVLYPSVVLFSGLVLVVHLLRIEPDPYLAAIKLVHNARSVYEQPHAIVSEPPERARSVGRAFFEECSLELGRAGLRTLGDYSIKTMSETYPQLVHVARAYVDPTETTIATVVAIRGRGLYRLMPGITTKSMEFCSVLSDGRVIETLIGNADKAPNYDPLALREHLPAKTQLVEALSRHLQRVAEHSPLEPVAIGTSLKDIEDRVNHSHRRQREVLATIGFVRGGDWERLIKTLGGPDRELQVEFLDHMNRPGLYEADGKIDGSYAPSKFGGPESR